MLGEGLHCAPDLEQLGGGADPPVGELGQTHRSHCGQISVLAPKDVTDSCAATVLCREKERPFRRGVEGGGNIVGTGGVLVNKIPRRWRVGG